MHCMNAYIRAVVCKSNEDERDQNVDFQHLAFDMMISVNIGVLLINYREGMITPMINNADDKQRLSGE